MPFSFMMGVDWEDSFIVGGLLGYKTFFNEFVAYEHLANLIKLRKKGGEMYIKGVKQYLSVSIPVQLCFIRSLQIIRYFTNFCPVDFPRTYF